MTARKNEVELLTTKFYNLHIVSVKKLVIALNGQEHKDGVL